MRDCQSAVSISDIRSSVQEMLAHLKILHSKSLKLLIFHFRFLPHSQGAWRTLLWHIQHFLGLYVPEDDDDYDHDNDDDYDYYSDDVGDDVFTSGTTTLRLTSRLVLFTELTWVCTSFNCAMCSFFGTYRVIFSLTPCSPSVDIPFHIICIGIQLLRV